MKRSELYQLHKDLSEQALEIMRRKNEDYSASSEDPFANFRGSVVLDTEPELGLMIRMQDKFQRVKAFLKTGKFAVVEEGIMDIGHDLINYSVLLTGLLIERIEAQKQVRRLEDAAIDVEAKVVLPLEEAFPKRRGPYAKRKVVPGPRFFYELTPTGDKKVYLKDIGIARLRDIIKDNTGKWSDDLQDAASRELRKRTNKIKGRKA